MIEKDVYTAKEVAEILGFDRHTIHNYLRAGQIRATKMGNQWRIPADSLKEFIATGTERNYLDKLPHRNT